MGGLTLLAVSPVSILPLCKRPAFLKDVFTYPMSVHNPVLGRPVASAVPQPVGQESRAQVRLQPSPQAMWESPLLITHPEAGSTGEFADGVSPCSHGWVGATPRARRQRPAIPGPVYPCAFVSYTFSRTLPGSNTPRYMCPWHLIGFAKSAP